MRIAPLFRAGTDLLKSKLPCHFTRVSNVQNLRELNEAGRGKIPDRDNQGRSRVGEMR